MQTVNVKYNIDKDKIDKALYGIVNKAQKYEEILFFQGINKKEISCSFCGKSQGLVEKMIVGNEGLAICNECVKTCVEILEEEKNIVPTESSQP